jgi:secretion/DNA translocation related CpaE-like protein
LPDAAGWLAEYLSHSSDPVSAGHVLGVIGGCGGAGASTAAILLAAQAARDGLQTLLIDGDAWGGGLELLVAAEEAPGLRWPDLAAASGSINPGQLEDSLPGIAGFSLLSWAAGPAMDGLPDMTGATQAVLEAARSGYRLTIIDVGRSLESISSFAWSCDEILVTVPAQLRATVATTQLIHELPGAGTSLLIRGQLRNGLDAQMIAESIGYPLAAHVPELKNAVAAAERGRVLELGSNRKVRRFTHHVLERLAERTVP